MKNRNAFLLVFLAFVAGFIGGQVGGVNAHGGDTSLIHGCVDDKTGALKIVGADDACPKGSSPLDWNIVGSTGPAGPAGPIGPKGDAGGKRVDFCFACEYSSYRDELGDSLMAADFSHGFYKWAHFEYLNLSNTNFNGAYLGNASLDHANLSNATFQGANLNNAVITNANLAGVDFTGANLSFANLTCSNLATANLTNVVWGDDGNGTTCPDGWFSFPDTYDMCDSYPEFSPYCHNTLCEGHLSPSVEQDCTQ